MGAPVITAQRAADFQQLVTDIVQDAAALPDMTGPANDSGETE